MLFSQLENPISEYLVRNVQDPMIPEPSYLEGAAALS